VRVVPALDELEHFAAGLDAGPEAPAIDDLTLQRREEALRTSRCRSNRRRSHRGRTPAAVQRWPKAIDVYWQP